MGQEQTGDDLVTVASFMHEFEAHLARTRLEHEGISAVVADANIIGVNWMLSNAVGGVRVQVPTSRVKEARAILAELEGGEPEVAGEERVCPKCGAHDAERVRTSWKIPLPYKRGELKCSECGHTWQPDS